MRYYEYIFYKTYLNTDKNGGSYTSTDFATSSVMALYLMLNSVTVLLLLNILDIINVFIPEYKYFLLICSLVQYGIVHLIFAYLNREGRIIEYYSTINRKNLDKYEIVYWVYRIISFISPFMLMYFI